MLFTAILFSVTACERGYEKNWLRTKVSYNKRDTEVRHGWSFQDLGSGIGRDKYHGYCFGYRLKGSDGKSFVRLAYRHGDRQVASRFARDRQQVYYCDKNLFSGLKTLLTYRHHPKYDIVTIQGADATSFVVLNYRYARDRYRAWYYYQPVDGVDTESFVALDSFYARDRYRVFNKGKATRYDAASFETLRGNYTRDRNGVYYRDQRLPGIDPKSFVALPQLNYYRDHRTVLFNGSKITGADVNSFVVLEYPYSRDKNHYYYRDKKSSRSEYDAHVQKIQAAKTGS